MSFKLPTKTDWMEQQMSQEPDRQYAEDIYTAVKLAKPEYKLALEIGAAWGISTLAILLAGDGHLTSIDKDPTVKAPSEVEANGLNHRWAFSAQDSASFWDENRTEFDLIYVDGSHLYADVLNDLFSAWEWLKDDGVLLIDDVIHVKNRVVDVNATEMTYGIALACWELVFKKGIQNVYTEGRLLYFIR